MGEPNEPGRSSSQAAPDGLQPGSTAQMTQTSTQRSLTPAQLHAAFDIITHYQTYAEVESFKHPGTISTYGFPFTLNSSSDRSGKYAARSSVPLLSQFLRSVILPLPGIRDLPSDFWSVRFQGILEKLAQAELSESYDKGALGTRKTLATAASAVHEYVSRGGLGGFPAGSKPDLHAEYDTTKAEDLARAWEDGVHELVYGDLIDELCDCIIERPSLEHHSPAVRAASDYVHIHLATFMHYVFVLSTEGQYLLKLVENMQQLIPYSMIKQTLRIGNAATMINGMIKLLLTKMSVGSLTNWMGLTQNADDGVNLLQRIITLVLSWDSSDFRKAVERVEKAKDGPLKEHLAAIKQHIQSPRKEHEAARACSQENAESIVVTILKKNRPDLLSKLSESDHAQLLDYYSAILSVRDREEITKVLCRQSPDLFTQALRDAVSAFDPMIRTVHEKLDIREHLSAMETFLNDFIKTSKPKPSKRADSVPQPPSVEDYVQFLRRNDNLLYSWLHQFASKCPELREAFRSWARDVIKTFRQDTKPNPDNSLRSQTGDLESRQSGAGDMSAALQDLYTGLPATAQEEVIADLNAHASYLNNLERLSNARMQTIIDNLAPGDLMPPSKYGTSTPKRSGTGLSTRSNTPAPSIGTTTPNRAASMAGPGIFLCRWQALLDQTIVTPATPEGPPRTGKEIKGNTTMGKTGAEASKDAWDPGLLAKQVEKDVPDAPNVDAALKAMLPGFRKLLAEKTKAPGRT